MAMRVGPVNDPGQATIVGESSVLSPLYAQDAKPPIHFDAPASLDVS